MQTTARINGHSISVAPRETLLEAALRQGVAFPSSCRVGGCATCKCRVTAGRVQERTESAYILSAPEVEAGFVLGCQAVPLTDVTVEVEAPAAEATRRVTGRIVAQTALTHDIAQIDLELDAPLPYQAGQNALLTLDTLPDVTRSYSFASPPGDGQRAQFFVRRVAGGALSTRLTSMRRSSASRAAAASRRSWPCSSTQQRRA
jgi:3-phenylpropionate/trans-cinnamate dioxygenase ferredoxin reductase subunit